MYYTPEQKKKYYSKRMNDKSLTEGQRKYAKRFVEENSLEKKWNKKEKLEKTLEEENNRIRKMEKKIMKQQWLNARRSHLCLVQNNDSYIVCWNNYASNLRDEELLRGTTFKTLDAAKEYFNDTMQELEPGIFHWFHSYCEKCNQNHASCEYTGCNK